MFRRIEQVLFDHGIRWQKEWVETNTPDGNKLVIHRCERSKVSLEVWVLRWNPDDEERVTPRISLFVEMDDGSNISLNYENHEWSLVRGLGHEELLKKMLENGYDNQRFRNLDQHRESLAGAEWKEYLEFFRSHPFPLGESSKEDPTEAEVFEVHLPALIHYFLSGGSES